jgi:hypothetical protein
VSESVRSSGHAGRAAAAVGPQQVVSGDCLDHEQESKVSQVYRAGIMRLCHS